MENQLSLIELKRREKKMKEKYSAPSFEVTELTDIITASSEQNYFHRQNRTNRAS